MRVSLLLPSGLVLVLACACGGSTPPPEEPVAMTEPEPPPAPPPAEPAEEPEVEAPPPTPAAAEPEFKEGMSVDEAIAAVPQGTARLNMETEVLSKPLMDMKVYEPCKPGSARFKVRVAVWDGSAVGVDVTTTPKNPKLADCLKTQIHGLKWDDKVKSLNTVEYQF